MPRSRARRPAPAGIVPDPPAAGESTPLAASPEKGSGKRQEKREHKEPRRTRPAPPDSPAPVPQARQGSESPPGGALRFSNAALARRVRQAVLDLPGVASVGSGSFLGAITYGLPGETISGVRVLQSAQGVSIEIHLTARMVPLPSLADDVRRAALDSLDGCVPCSRIDVFIDDLVDDLINELDGSP